MDAQTTTQSNDTIADAAETESAAQQLLTPLSDEELMPYYFLAMAGCY